MTTRAVLVAVIVLLAASCGSQAAKLSSGASSGVYGLVTAGPTCPVEQAGHPCPPAPVKGRLEASDVAGSVVTFAVIGRDGSYRLALNPGTYDLVVMTGSTFPRCPNRTVTLPEGNSFIRTDISCDSGIR